MKSNIKTISELTGFSLATVSNVLNNKKNVKKSTAELILKTAKQIGYLEQNSVENVKVVMYKKSGEVLTETPLIHEFLEGVEKEAQNHNLTTQIFSISESDPDFEDKIQDVLYSHNSAIILLATEMELEDVQRFESIKDRLIVADCFFREGGYDCVLMDNSNSFYNVVNYLYKKGHRSIKLIDSSIQIRNFKSRKCGFMIAMQEKGLPFDEDSFLHLHPTMTGAYLDMLDYLKEHKELPDAFCAINDIIALGAMKAIQECGYRIPEDVSIMGFDNMPFGNIISPSLTTVNVLKSEMGVMAARTLISKIESSEKIPVMIQLQTSIIERQSVGTRNVTE